tara:strand:- start:1290 stop:1463 length:174 start_codon:yes stop_codon:yes gene_type:complete
VLDDLPTVLSSLAAVDPPVITAFAVASAAAAAASDSYCSAACAFLIRLLPKYSSSRA